MVWQQEQWVRCPGCGHPRDETWVDRPERERELRERYHAEPHLCVACDEVARSQKQWASAKSAYAGGVYHILQDATLRAEDPPSTPNGRQPERTPEDR